MKKKYTLKKRLAMYQKALKDYQANTKWTDRGFCNYFRFVHFDGDTNIYTDFENILPELFSTFSFIGPYCFQACEKYGNVPERHECLKKAIKIIEAKIKKVKK